MPKPLFLLPLLALGLTSGLLATAPLPPDGPAPDAKLPGLDLNPPYALQAIASQADPLGSTHVRYQEYFLGVPVWGGEAITHIDAAGQPLEPTDGLYRGLDLSPLPSLTPSEALALARGNLAQEEPFTAEPTATLVIFPIKTRTHLTPGHNATDWVSRVERYALAYHVHTESDHGTLQTVHMDYLIDAHTGSILRQWDTLKTSAATGSGRTQYNGTVALATNSTAKGFELRDLTRGQGGAFHNNVVTNLDHATGGMGAIYSNSTNLWGDGANFTGDAAPTAGTRGQTAAADAAYGLQVTWDMYRNVFQRHGIDGKGKATYCRVHYSKDFDNAFWDDTCFCMTHGDGKTLKSLEALDVMGHEMSHGVCSTTANLDYTGESGGLNEANSDIFGTMAEYYAKGGGYAAGAATIPATGGNWTIGEQVSATPIRYLYKPSKDAISPDAWSPFLGFLDVHFSSGPMNRCFYFLSQGASLKDGDEHSEYLPLGMKGLGNDQAARIWYRALTSYLLSSSGYADARNAAIRAAKDLYGAGGEAERAVWNAFHGINVGKAWPTPAPTYPGQDLIVNGGFEQGTTGWAGDTSVIGASSAQPALSGSREALLCGTGSTTSQSLYQTVTIPAAASQATLRLYLHIDTTEFLGTAADFLRIQVQDPKGKLLKELASYSNLDSNPDYLLRSFDVKAFQGQTVRICFLGTEDWLLQTSFVVDDVSLNVE